MEHLHPGIPYWTTQGEYGPKVGIYRILKLLDKENIKATFCVVGKVAEKYPQSVEEIVQKGHEVAVHGYTHTAYNQLSLKQEKTEIIKTRKILSEFTETPPIGHRTPRWMPSKNTLKILKEEGFLWSSDHMGSEVPFYNVIEEEKTNILEIPVAYNLDDWPYYFSWMKTASEVVEIWSQEFNLKYKEKSMFCPTIHPQVTGRASRMIVLEKVIEHIKKYPNIEFMRVIDYLKKGYVSK